LNLQPITDSPFTIAGTKIVPLPVMHLNMPVFGFRLGDLCYITDANEIPASTLEKMKGTRVLVLNALQREKHVSHFNLEEAVAVATSIGSPNTYLTHLSHRMGLHKEVATELPVGVELAYDGLSVTL
jgi:phosphoribosyl 1,2-cyclic phosphate phosphodiesterase